MQLRDYIIKNWIPLDVVLKAYGIDETEAYDIFFKNKDIDKDNLLYKHRCKNKDSNFSFQGGLTNFLKSWFAIADDVNDIRLLKNVCYNDETREEASETLLDKVWESVVYKRRTETIRHLIQNSEEFFRFLNEIYH